MSILKRFFSFAEDLIDSPRALVFIIDPETQTITERQETEKEVAATISEIVGEDAECYKLDNGGNALWASDTDTNERYAYYFEAEFSIYPFNLRRYSKGLIVSLGPAYLDEDAIKTWLVWYDKENVWGDE